MTEMENSLEELLGLALKEADSAEVIGVESEWASIEFKAGRLSKVERGYTTGAGLRVIKGLSLIHI